jgi:hypothetical protein
MLYDLPYDDELETRRAEDETDEIEEAEHRYWLQSVAGVALAPESAETLEALERIGSAREAAALADAAADRLHAARLAGQVARWERIVADYAARGMRTYERHARRTLAGARRAAGLPA